MTKAKWKIIREKGSPYYWWECSSCGFQYYVYACSSPAFRGFYFCPWCGTRLIDPDDEEENGN